jgi:hypothetical protein
VCFKYQRAEVAQSVEQGTENPRVSGSIPFLGTSIPGAYSLSRPKRDRPLKEQSPLSLALASENGPGDNKLIVFH